MYYIQNVKENHYSPLVSWWRFNDYGYTPNLSEAKQFTLGQIKEKYSIEKGDKRAWPEDYIDGLNKDLIQEKDLDIEMAWKFEKITK